MERTGPATLHNEGAATHFDRTTTVHLLSEDGETPPGTFRFAADLDETWASLRGVHGGYVTSLTVRAAEAVFPDRDVRTVAASFLRPTEVGPAEIVLDVVPLRPVVRHRHRHRAPTRPRRRSPPASPCSAGRPVPGGRHPCGIGRRRGRRASRSRRRRRSVTSPRPTCSWTRPPCRPATPATRRLAGHVRPKEARPFDAPWLVMIGDWFPPSPFRRLTPPTGGVSIDYTVHVHQTVPASADLWLEGVFRADTNVDGIALEHGTLSLPDGGVVAETFHTRWTG